MTTDHTNLRRAVFLDRDGTLIEHVHYLTDPAEVRLAVGAGAALRLLHEHGFACIIVTNQSAIGRGMLTEERLTDIHEVLKQHLEAEGTAIDGIYFCPLAPSKTNEGDRLAVEHPDRKPGPGMLLRAADELNLDLKRSYMIGDMLSDIYAGQNAGVRGSVLIEGHVQEIEITAHNEAIAFKTKSLLEAAQWICGHADVNDNVEFVDKIDVS